MTHTWILLTCLLVGWGLASVLMRATPHLTRWGDRRAFHQLAIASPLLALFLSGGWSAQMAIAGCLMFSTSDGIATLLLTSAVLATVSAAATVATWRHFETRRMIAASVSSDVETPILDLVQSLASRLRVRPPNVAMVELDRPFACVVGIAHTKLVLSRWVIDRLAPDEREVLIAHELAHLRHMDNLLAWCDVVLLRAFSFLPTLHTAWRESLAEREEAADTLAVLVTGKPLALAQALVKVAEWSPQPLAATAASAFDGDMALLERRVERLLYPAHLNGRVWGAPAVAAAIVGALLPFVTAWALGAATSCLGHF